VLKREKHAQGTISYTVSPVHTVDLWVNLGKEIEQMGADSICIKDMAGLLKPYIAFELVSRLKETLSIPVHIQCHATTGMSTATYLKCIEAGIDNVDAAVSSMSMTYGHSPTESLVAILEGTERDTGLDMELLEEIAGYFREVRKKYAKFEGSLKGVDSRILVAQVPGGMLTNLENQLREQNASERIDEVLEEIPRVRKELGYIPLVTPTSQIVGTQSVINILSGERYKSVTKETMGVLKGEYGVTPAPLDSSLQAQVLGNETPITCRPADLIEPELDSLTKEFNESAKKENFVLATEVIDDVLSYALFPQVATHFLKNRNDPSAFEAAPGAEVTPTEEQGASCTKQAELYNVRVEGKSYIVEVSDAGEIQQLSSNDVRNPPSQTKNVGEEVNVNAPLAGNIVKIPVSAGQQVGEGDVLLVMEAMKMETEICSPTNGVVKNIAVEVGSKVGAGSPLVTLE
jgi:oxaloacetate decarboxylase alpha subunit